jgi:hypothetical protein
MVTFMLCTYCPLSKLVRVIEYDLLPRHVLLRVLLVRMFRPIVARVESDDSNDGEVE